MHQQPNIVLIADTGPQQPHRALCDHEAAALGASLASLQLVLTDLRATLEQARHQFGIEQAEKQVQP